MGTRLKVGSNCIPGHRKPRLMPKCPSLSRSLAGPSCSGEMTSRAFSRLPYLWQGDKQGNFRVQQGRGFRSCGLDSRNPWGLKYGEFVWFRVGAGLHGVHAFDQPIPFVELVRKLAFPILSAVTSERGFRSYTCTLQCSSYVGLPGFSIVGFSP